MKTKPNSFISLQINKMRENPNSQENIDTSGAEIMKRARNKAVGVLMTVLSFIGGTAITTYSGCEDPVVKNPTDLNSSDTLQKGTFWNNGSNIGIDCTGGKEDLDVRTEQHFDNTTSVPLNTFTEATSNEVNGDGYFNIEFKSKTTGETLKAIFTESNGDTLWNRIRVVDNHDGGTVDYAVVPNK